MKSKKILSILLLLTLMFGIFVIPASAAAEKQTLTEHYVDSDGEVIAETTTLTIDAKDAPAITGYTYKSQSTNTTHVYAEQHIQYIIGYPDGGVKVEKNMTRAEAVVVLYRLYNGVYPAFAKRMSNNTFADVDSSAWYYKELETLYNAGIIDDAEYFRPNTPITRAEFAVLCAKYDGLTYLDKSKFADVQTGHWAYSYINAAAEKGWIKGYPDGSFKPDNYITRAEIMALVNRLFNRPVTLAQLPENINPYNDITESHWAFCDAMEATVKHDTVHWHGAAYNDGVYNIIIEKFVDTEGKEIAEPKIIVAKENHHPTPIAKYNYLGFITEVTYRDAIQDIKRDALADKFDILLVFMFDRLGRRDDETPFVVQWFAQQGIEVWSTKEGEQRFDSHVDKLMNYIRYWQASGESEKTSIRVKTRLRQIVQEGRFRGGVPAYGYTIEKQGRINKRGHEVYEILIHPDEAAIVRLIFDKYINEGYGSHRIAGFLTDMGIRTRKGSNFVNCTIQHMLKNETYTGIIKCGETKTEIFSELQIIDPETFDVAQELLRQRSSSYQERTMPLHTKGKGLLSGNVFCGHCGGRLVQTSNTKYARNTDGSIAHQYVRVRYICYNKTRHKDTCDGQTGYTVSKVDEHIDKIIRAIFARMKGSPSEELLAAQYKDRLEELQVYVKNAKQKANTKQSAYDAYKQEMQKVITGDSPLDRATVTEIVIESKQELEAALLELNRCRTALDDTQGVYSSLLKEQNKKLSWAQLYERGSHEAKKMVVANLVKRATIKRNYEISLDLNISYEDYMGERSGKGLAENGNSMVGLDKKIGLDA